MDPCRSCLRCLPFFQVSPPASPRPATATTVTHDAVYPEHAEAASKPWASPDAGKCTADVPCQGQDLPSSDKIKEDEVPNFDNVQDTVTAKNELGTLPVQSEVDNIGGDSASIETYPSQTIISPGISDDDDNDTPEDTQEGLDHNAAHLGQPRRRRRDRFKQQFKGISQQIKQGRHHIKEEGSKHLQTIISNMNKQAQQIEQSASFFTVPRANHN